MNNLARIGESQLRGTTPLHQAKAGPRSHIAPISPASGFSLVEILIAMFVLMIISAIAVPKFLDAMDQARIARAVGDVRTIGNAVISFQVVNQQFPETLSQVGYGANVDPWHNPYQYLNLSDVGAGSKARKDRFGVQINSYFDLYSMGEDGQTSPPLNAPNSQDDIIWALDGDYAGRVLDF